MATNSNTKKKKKKSNKRQVKNQIAEFFSRFKWWEWLAIVAIIITILIGIFYIYQKIPKRSHEPEPVEEETPYLEVTSIPTFDRQYIYRDEGVEIIADSVYLAKSLGYGIRFEFVNNRERDVSIRTTDLTVNGVMAKTGYNLIVYGGEKMSDIIYLGTDVLFDYGLETVSEFECAFSITEMEGRNAVEDVPVIQTELKHIYTTTRDYEQELDKTDSKVVYEENGVKISTKLVSSDPDNGRDVLLFIENNNKEDISIQAENITIDDAVIKWTLYRRVSGKRESLDAIRIPSYPLRTENSRIMLNFTLSDSNHHVVANIKAQPYAP